MQGMMNNVYESLMNVHVISILKSTYQLPIRDESTKLLGLAWRLIIQRTFIVVALHLHNLIGLQFSSRQNLLLSSLDALELE